MEGWEEACGRVEGSTWKGGRKHVEGWEVEGWEEARGRMGGSTWKGGRKHVEGWEEARGRAASRVAREPVEGPSLKCSLVRVASCTCSVSECLLRLASRTTSATRGGHSPSWAVTFMSAESTHDRASAAAVAHTRLFVESRGLGVRATSVAP